MAVYRHDGLNVVLMSDSSEGRGFESRPSVAPTTTLVGHPSSQIPSECRVDHRHWWRWDVST